MGETKDKLVKIQYGSFSISIEGYDKPYKVLRKVTKIYSDISKDNPNFGAIPVAAVYKSPELKNAQETTATNSAGDPNNIWTSEKPNLLVLGDPTESYTRTDPTQVLASAEPLKPVELVSEPTSDSTFELLELSENAPKFQAPKYPFRKFPSKSI